MLLPTNGVGFVRAARRAHVFVALPPRGHQGPHMQVKAHGRRWPIAGRFGFFGAIVNRLFVDPEKSFGEWREMI